ncbi:ankyrin repeat-containing domain protein [Talaromyces proteolyticus]|uniref:Ankyrin repeat-containing domain protein n=1 Tax=Talaromyces proteolyticus TaxID=1131652 RepID=A0AAD4L1S1_9EURO|nr:ankyrin repeat-containing domain protein [Talaromyces proteolyticus]KAH8705963.1 ankyrin repeat-containing domain protein [Talaromyces proteolyticus]
MARSKEEDAAWEGYRNELKVMFLDQRLTLEQIRQYMSQKYNFSKSKGQYTRQFKKWEFKKNFTDDDWRFVAHRREKRKREGKDPGPVRMNGNLVPEAKVRKEISRHILPSSQYLGTVNGDVEPRTPEGIVVGTPNSEMQGADSRYSVSALQTDWLLDSLEADQPEVTLESDIDLTSSNAIPTPQSGSSHAGLESLNKEIVKGTESLFMEYGVSRSRNICGLSKFLEPITIGSVHSDLIRKARTIFQADSSDNLSHYLSLCVYLSSNNLLPSYAMDKLIRLLAKTKPKLRLKTLLQSHTTTTEIFMSDLLASAASLGEVEITRILINHGADVDAMRGDFPRVTPLCLAIEGENVGCVKLLLEAGADPNLAVAGNTPLQTACSAFEISIEILELLLKSGAHLNPAQDSARLTALQLAVRRRRADVVRLLIQWKADPNSYTTSKHGTALQVACSSSNVEIPELLINAGANIEARSDYKDNNESLSRTYFDHSDAESISESDHDYDHDEFPDGLFRFKSAIVIAADYKNWETVQILLEEGAAVNPSMRVFPTKALRAQFMDNDVDWDGDWDVDWDGDWDGNWVRPVILTPLQAAVRAENITMTRMLLSAGAHVDARPKGRYGHTALQIAAMVGNQRLVQILLLKGADINADAGVFNGKTALQAAACHSDTGLLSFLLNEGADANAPHPRITATKGNVDAVRILLDAGASVNIDKNCNEGLVALQESIQIKDLEVREEIISLLLEAGAHFEPPTDPGKQGSLGTADHGKHGSLHTAVARRDIDMTKRLLKRGANPNIGYCMTNNHTPLQRASYLGNETLVHMLVSHGADINAPAYPSGGHTALQLAASQGHVKIVKILLDSGANVRAPKASVNGISAIGSALCECNHELIKIFLNKDPEIISSDPITRRDALGNVLESWKCTVSLVNLLLKNGADVNTPPCLPALKPCLQIAVQKGYFDIVQCLLTAGADVNRRWTPGKYERGVTALQAAAYTRNIDIVRMLIEWGADVNAPASPTDGGRTALQIAVSENYFEMVQLLVQNGADINGQPSPQRGRTALQIAASSGYMKLTKYLLQRNADINAPAAHFGGITALQGASIKGNIRIVMMLLAAGANINAPPAIENGRSAIEGAAENGRLDTLHLLLNYHPDTEDFEIRRKRAAKLALANGHLAIGRFLMAYRKSAWK